MPARIFLTGASGTGKTTLADAFATKNGWRMVVSKTSEIATRFGGMANVEANLDVRIAFQSAVFDDLVDRIRAAEESRHPYIVERCFDPIYYAAVEQCGCGHLAKSRSFGVLEDLVKGSSHSVLCRVPPTFELNNLARLSDGERRSRYLRWDYVQKIDGACLLLLQTYGFPWKSIPDGIYHLETRITFLESLVSNAGANYAIGNPNFKRPENG